MRTAENGAAKPPQLLVGERTLERRNVRRPIWNERSHELDRGGVADRLLEDCPATRPQHPPDFSRHERQIEMVQDRDPEDDIDRSVGKRQVVRRADDELRAAGAPVHGHATHGEADEIFRDVDAPHVRASIGELHRVAARPAPEIDDPQAAARRRGDDRNTRADKAYRRRALRTARGFGRTHSQRGVSGQARLDGAAFDLRALPSLHLRRDGRHRSVRGQVLGLGFSTQVS